MFQNFKFSIDVQILPFLGYFIKQLGKLLFNFLVTLIVRDVENKH
jgi:hypothetical protein